MEEEVTEEQTYTLGIDVGSTTAKVVLMTADNQLVYHSYQRHQAQVAHLLEGELNKLIRQYGDIPVRLCVTGSVGMQTAQQLQAAFLQEVVAATTYARQLHPEARALIDIGGEDAKVVFFDGQRTELRMNGNCAGGTGAFIDQMAVLMGVSNEEMNDLAMKATTVYPMAARCGVFAKTDIQNLMSRNLPESDIAASIFHSIAVQTVTTLSHGCTFAPPILLCGGPLTFLPALRKAFSAYLHIADSDFIISPNSNLIPAMGCALRARKEDHAVKLSALLERVTTTTVTHWHSKLAPLFTDEDDYARWKADKARFQINEAPLRQGRQDVFLGIDSGSTTTKVVALRMDDGHPVMVFSDYRMNLGNPILAVRKALQRMEEESSKAGADLHILGSCSTGYGEELIHTAFHLSGGMIETMAHYRAARELMPDVSFILDIGGQDMKAIFVDHGAVVRMELNEACSSGCGTFIQTFATSLGYKVEDFARLACESKAPCDLGTRCTVFMNSKVKQVLREGAGVADISAGIAYSVIKNCLYKVLKFRDARALGRRVVVQGGTMRNDAVVRAFERLSGVTVARSSHPELMGAVGCALHAAEMTVNHSTEATGAVTTADASTIADLLAQANYTTRQLQCHGCQNQCRVTRYTFADGARFFTGNRCERVFNNAGKSRLKGENVYTYKYNLLFDRPLQGATADRGVIGIPRALNIYEDYPFWNALLRACGFRIVLSPESTYSHYEQALGTVMADNICFPAKLVHSHIMALDADASVDRILMPYVVYERQEDPRHTINSYNCPIVSGYSDVIKSAMNLHKPMDSPVINFSDEKLLERQITSYLHSLGVSRHEARKALTVAIEAQRSYGRLLKQHCKDILRKSRQEGRLTILLAGRPYHTDPLIQHKLSEMVADLGVNVISEDLLRETPDLAGAETYLVKQWAYMNRIMKAAQWVATEGPDVHFVEMTSFGCGPDAFIQDENRDILRRAGKPFTLLKIDDVSNVGSLKLRVRSLVESLREHKKNMLNREVRKDGVGEGQPMEKAHSTALPQLPPFTAADRHKKILAPFLTSYLSPMLPALFRLMGYDVEVLPMADGESADLGLKNANNEVCYPATLIVGDIIKALHSGRYDLKNVAVAMSQTGGQCRATNYVGLIKRAMIANGFGDIPLITLGVTVAADGGHASSQFSIDWKKYTGIAVVSILFGDALNEMYYATLVRERQPGLARRLRDEALTGCCRLIADNKPKEILHLLDETARKFDRAVLDEEHPKVGIVGEIFLKFNPFSHQFLEKYIVSKGIEVVPPLLAPFFLQEFVNVGVQKDLGLKRSHMPNMAVRALYQMVIGRRIRQINAICSHFRYFRPFSDIYSDARAAEPIVNLAAQFGEGWLLPADVVGYLHDGINNVLSLQPFGCIANQVISKGIEKKLNRMYPQLNMLSLDFDSGVSAVNITNRLLLFLDKIKE
ncbi:MAG: acyl-CoA dehydratase activase [Prevotellaceae bacterium]|nr:acyl-CoA dehydratase activase [Prevotellaceae bacterium]